MSEGIPNGHLLLTILRIRTPIGSKCLLLGIISTLVSAGCATLPMILQPFPRAVQIGNAQLLLFSGRYVTNSFDGSFQVVRYGVQKHSWSGSVWITVEVAFYRKTLQGELPREALLILKQRKNGGVELLGMDATHSILADTPENRLFFERAITKGTLLPPRSEWLPKRSAISIAQKAFSNRKLTRVSAIRYEFGWEVSVAPPEGESSYGDERFVTVGDDGEIKVIHGGL